MKTTFYTLILALSVLSCKEEAKESTSEMAISEVPAAIVEEVKFKPLEDNSSDQSTDAEQITIPQQIIKNGNLRFETDDLEATALKVKEAVTKYKGQIQSDSETRDNYALSRTLTLRVPSARFEDFIANISTGVKHFDEKEISSEDVTEEYIDTEARLKAKKVLEARYFELLKKANKVSEMLEIEKQISELREEIESQEGRLRYIKSRVAMSTIHLVFYKHIETGGGTTVSYGSKMGNAIKSGFNSLSTFLLELLYIWPFILIFVIVFIVIRKKIKKKRNTNA
ncbi:DUF4349 domain-containing protein [Flavobacterium sp. Sd200]|uniref:DUF4349 domain-containing protein n=1 Tax=Flavobacterium sp. Sd200 TaxID=2692211 RepID=UPI0013714E4D|nr:DUF4349 domain-containing protein [Flavobacterium sp. Sd200]MXN92680.1 DUF4349 domain-containing protein [Flavobacterium sp. Sd200]